MKLIGQLLYDPWLHLGDHQAAPNVLMLLIINMGNPVSVSLWRWTWFITNFVTVLPYWSAGEVRPTNISGDRSHVAVNA